VNLKRVAELVIVVSDLDAARKFYCDVLELPVIRELRDSVQLAAGRVQLTLLDVTHLPPDSPADRIDSLTFETHDDLDGSQQQCFDIQGAEVSVAVPGVVPPVSPLLPSPWVRNIDHIVVASGDSGNTAAAFEAKLGLEIKRTMIRPGTNAQLAFMKLGEVIIEFAGPPTPQDGPITARYWGIVFNVRNLDAVLARAREAGLPTGEPKAAVQPGARIVSIKDGTGGVPVAFIEYAAR